MKQAKRARIRRLLGFLLIAIPWFLRDQVAATFDRDTQDLDAVLIEKDGQQQDEAQARYQRELAFTLARIELRLESQQSDSDDIEQKAEELWKDSIKGEGAELIRSADNLSRLLGRVNMPQDEAHKIMTSVQEARDVGQRLQRDDSEPEDLFKAWDEAETKLRASYESVAEQAQTDSAGSSGLATIFRFIAWICTAAGALLAGDWLSLLRGSTGTGDEAAQENQAAVV